MKKDLNYYMSLPYKIEIIPLSEAEGGGFQATIPQLGKYAIVADGDTEQDAVEELKAIKKERFAEYLKHAVDIPEPSPSEEALSGRFVVRLPKRLHATLVDEADKEGVSLNLYVNHLLSSNLHLDKQEKQLNKVLEEISCIHKHLDDVYKYEERPLARPKLSLVTNKEYEMVA